MSQSWDKFVRFEYEVEESEPVGILKFDWRQALIQACSEGKIETVEAILKRDCSADIPHNEALCRAIRGQHLEVVRLLLNHGASATDSGVLLAVPIIQAFSENTETSLELVELLLERGARIRTQKDRPLQMSVRKGSLELTKYCLDAGAELSNLSEGDLIHVLEKGHKEMVKFLLEGGVNFEEAFKHQLYMASKTGNLEEATFLVESGANLRADNDEALRVAIVETKFEVADFLVSRGAEISSFSREDIQRIQPMNLQPILVYLRGRGVDVKKLL